MARRKNNNLSEPQKEEKQQLNEVKQEIKIKEDENKEIVNENIEVVQEETAESNQDTQNIENEIEAAVKEYNGETDVKNEEERRIKVRETSEMDKFEGKVSKKTLVIILSIVFAIIISFVAIALVNKMNSNVYRNVYLNDKNLTGMTNSELAEYLRAEQIKIGKRNLQVFQGDEKILEIVPADINLEIDVSKVEAQVFGYGRNSNVLKNNIDIMYAFLFKKDFELIYKYDVAKLSEIVKEIKESLDNKVIDDSYIVDENEYKLIITKGKSGNTIDEQETKNNIIEGLANGMGEYNLKIINGKPCELDVDVVYSQVKRQAEDAYIDKSTAIYKFVPHKVGLDFNKDDLEKILLADENKQEGKVIEYGLTVIQPKIKTTDIKWELYEYQISTYKTNFATSDANRVNNLRVALNLLNGKVIMPGEVFSYNSVVGAATAAQGFKPAATFSGGRVIREVGGGICQTVSTLYNAALLADLEIVQRKAHSLPVAYVQPSTDATVYYPSIDFKFKNTREFPIKIVTHFNSGGSLTISLYGTQQENEYVISITSKKTSIVPYKEQYIQDDSMEKGTQQVVQTGSNGYTSEAHITKKLNGQIVSTKLLSKDTYKAVNKIIRIGTKEVAAPPVQKPQENQNNNTNAGTNTETNTGTQPSENTGTQQETTKPNE